MAIHVDERRSTSLWTEETCKVRSKMFYNKEKRLLLDILLNVAEANSKAARNSLPEFEKRLMEEGKARIRLYVLFALAYVAFSLSFARLICLILTYR